MAWVRVKASQLGKRSENQDFAVVSTVRRRRMRLTILLACDGVGGRPGGRECAAAVGMAVQKEVEAHFAKRRSRRGINVSDLHAIADRVRRLHSLDANPDSATTLALAVFAHRPGRGGYRTLVIWAGDSRVFLADKMGRFHQLSNDHHDEEGRITSFISGDGRLNGELSANLVTTPAPISIAVTTDGLHSSCTGSELRNFLLGCIERGVVTDDHLAEEMDWFIDSNVSDNYSMAWLYRGLNRRQLAAVAHNI